MTGKDLLDAFGINAVIAVLIIVTCFIGKMLGIPEFQFIW